jgi:hypothetical protein
VPLQSPDFDTRKFQDLVTEVRARIPVHTPEYTNFNQSDPGQTLIDVFGFLSETLHYRLNRYPEGNRRKFLRLLGMPLQEAAAAQGLVTFANDRGPLARITLDDGTVVSTGKVPFVVQSGLDVLPVTAMLVYKQAITQPDPDVLAYYQQLYASYHGKPPDANNISLYNSVTFDPSKGVPVDLSKTVGNCLWIALLARSADLLEDTRKVIAGSTLNIGMVPYLTNAQRVLAPGGQASIDTKNLLTVELPLVPDSGLPDDPTKRVPQYQPLTVSTIHDVFSKPGILQVSLPGDPKKLALWQDLDALEGGVGEFPPTLSDTASESLIISWLRIRLARGTQAVIYYAGINAALVEQREHILNELMPTGTGEPDQTVQLAHPPVISQSVSVTVAPQGGTLETWQPIDDLSAAGPEVPVPDYRNPPGAVTPPPPSPRVFKVDGEAGRITFGDGLRGARPPLGAKMRVAYDFSVGLAGNLGPGSIKIGAPNGMTVTNPIPTWGGANAETVDEGEKQIPLYLQHRDRLVTLDDFQTITKRTPGVNIGRVEVLPAYNPQLTTSEPGDTPGAVTLMVIPQYDPQQPDAPQPDRLFLNTICQYLDPRRLITTELFLRGPNYVPIWVSVGVKTAPAFSSPVVLQAVRQIVKTFLAPLTDAAASIPDMPPVILTRAQPVSDANGWPLRKSVLRLELEAVVSRVPGVEFVQQLILAKGTDSAVDEVILNGLDLPQLVNISASEGDPVSLDDLRGDTTGTGTAVPVPYIPEECH